MKLRLQQATLEVLFPKVRAKLLQVLFDLPPKQRYVRELTRMTGLALHTVQDELRRLTALGLVVSWSNGYHRFYVANREHPMFEHLLHVVEISGRLPKTNRFTLKRPTGMFGRNKRAKPKLRRLTPDRPLTWGIFSKQHEKRRAPKR